MSMANRREVLQAASWTSDMAPVQEAGQVPSEPSTELTDADLPGCPEADPKLPTAAPDSDCQPVTPQRFDEAHHSTGSSSFKESKDQPNPSHKAAAQRHVTISAGTIGQLHSPEEEARPPPQPLYRGRTKSLPTNSPGRNQIRPVQSSPADNTLSHTWTRTANSQLASAERVEEEDSISEDADMTEQGRLLRSLLTLAEGSLAEVGNWGFDTIVLGKVIVCFLSHPDPCSNACHVSLIMCLEWNCLADEAGVHCSPLVPIRAYAAGLLS